MQQFLSRKHRYIHLDACLAAFFFQTRNQAYWHSFNSRGVNPLFTVEAKSILLAFCCMLHVCQLYSRILNCNAWHLECCIFFILYLKTICHIISAYVSIFENKIVFYNLNTVVNLSLYSKACLFLGVHLICCRSILTPFLELLLEKIKKQYSTICFCAAILM